MIIVQTTLGTLNNYFHLPQFIIKWSTLIQSDRPTRAETGYLLSSFQRMGLTQGGSIELLVKTATSLK